MDVTDETTPSPQNGCKTSSAWKTPVRFVILSLEWSQILLTWCQNAPCGVQLKILWQIYDKLILFRCLYASVSILCSTGNTHLNKQLTKIIVVCLTFLSKGTHFLTVFILVLCRPMTFLVWSRHSPWISYICKDQSLFSSYWASISKSV